MVATRRASRSSRLARWQTACASPTGRHARADPDNSDLASNRDDELSSSTVNAGLRTQSMPAGTRPCSGNSQSCSCRSCVLTRWQESLPSRKGGRQAFARESWTWSTPSSNASSKRSSAASDELRASFGFEPVRTVDEFAARNGRGPNIHIEEQYLQDDGTLEQTLKLNNLKLTLSLAGQQGQGSKPAADGSQRMLTVSKRRRAGERANAINNSYSTYEVVYTWRGHSTTSDRRPIKSVDHLAARTQQALSKAETTGEAAAVTELVEGAAAAYGTSVVALVAAVHAIAPELGKALADPLGAAVP